MKEETNFAKFKLKVDKYIKRYMKQYSHSLPTSTILMNCSILRDFLYTYREDIDLKDI